MCGQSNLAIVFVQKALFNILSCSKQSSLFCSLTNFHSNLTKWFHGLALHYAIYASNTTPFSFYTFNKF